MPKQLKGLPENVEVDNDRDKNFTQTFHAYILPQIVENCDISTDEGIGSLKFSLVSSSIDVLVCNAAFLAQDSLATDSLHDNMMKSLQGSFALSVRDAFVSNPTFSKPRHWQVNLVGTIMTIRALLDRMNTDGHTAVISAASASMTSASKLNEKGDYLS